ncbi:MAG: leucine-rich repeat domain-containing protein [Bacteroidales bacterium]|jgi:hypothetical protein|nr:leucine-rich repeat domain-containing protein [Bacteroidales bacterium]
MNNLVLFTGLLSIFVVLISIIFCSKRKCSRTFTVGKLKFAHRQGKTLECITYEGNAPSGNLLIPNSVQRYKDHTVTTIGKAAFQYCGNLTSATIQEGITTIGSYAFANCCHLESVIIPSTVTEIGSYAFANCTALRTIISRNPLPPHLALHTFYNVDTSLCTLYVPESVDLANRSAEKWKNFLNILHEEPEK